jgi:hypothetical protein
MDIKSALHEVTRWCAEQTQAGDPEQVEVDAHAAIWITIGESAPPWHVRWQRRCSSGASAPVAQLRYDLETREWALHHGGPPGRGWCDPEDAVRSKKIGPLLAAIEADRDGRFVGLGPGYRWPWT